MQEDTMKSLHKRLLLATGIVALTFAGPINAPAASFDIDDDGRVVESRTPTVINQTGFTQFNTVAEVHELSPGNGLLILSGNYVATNPLGGGVVQSFNFNFPEPPALTCDGSTCSDTLSITLAGAPGGPGGANMAFSLTFRSGQDGLAALPGGVVPPGLIVIGEGEFLSFSSNGLDVRVFSDVPVPGPIVGAGLPGLLAACGGLLALARRRHRRTA
jgi:hypothetical protein